MGSLIKIIFCFFILTNSLFSFFPDNEKNYLYYLMHKNNIYESLSSYQKLKLNNNSHDFEALQQLSLILLELGGKNKNPDIQQLTMFGAGISNSNDAIDILQKGLFSPSAEAQLIALHFLSNIHDNRVDDLLIKAMSSEFLMTRMEAAFTLAIRKHAYALGQIESLMHRLPPFFKPFFPTFFVVLGTPQATKVLKQLLSDSNPAVRIETILSISKANRDDFLPYIRNKISHSNIPELEAIVYALGVLRDNSSYHNLKKIMQTAPENVRIAAATSLYKLGDNKALGYLIKLAEKNNLPAISALSDFSNSETFLATLLNKSLPVRINAGISLLKRKDPRCVPILLEILIKDERDISLQPAFTVGRSTMYWKAITSSSQRKKDPSVNPSAFLQIREYLLKEALELPKHCFLEIAKAIFNHEQNDLVPLLTSLLENIRTKEAIAFLKQGTKKLGSPLIRDYCNLSLFRLSENGPYEEHVINWAKQQKQTPFIRLHQFIPAYTRLKEKNYQLSPEQTSRLLIDMYTAMASKQNEKMIDILIESIKNGKESNRFVLAGILLKATE
jgi:HEAT repeat protein